jgi:mannose-6-phosphate isomerase-like protein (cupin superfamily)
VAHAGQEIHGHDGFRLLLVRTAAESGGDVLEMEASYSGEAPMPPAHVHPRQEERFEVLEGAMHTIVGGVERRYGPGEPFTVPAGTPHQMGAIGPTRLRWEVRPALRTAEFFEGLHDGSAAAAPAEFFAEFSDEFRFSAA